MSALMTAAETDGAGHGAHPGETYSKRLARVQAEFAIAGWEIYPLQAGTLIVANFGMHRVIDDLDAAEKMLTRIKGARHG